ncbi:tail fiber domain-containing protein [Hoeflea poritis]|uniref:Tail fiber domain-containing protein n=1 Tax=Hoeflea poritis TaxID=2993659 RepID=A0ABT4VML0_9HYPH|nr:tail fiber domain-containing protein [Hoeflea poritis]MDA4845958.1 tail fiber domain-containing protein [Hoeflea poritis]
MVSKGGSSAPAPDPNIGRAALKQAETGEAWLTFAKEAFQVSTERQAELDALTKEVTDLNLAAANEEIEFARRARERYESTFIPLEDEFIKEASEYGSKERQDAAAAEAKADVQKASADQKEQQQRSAAALGINPTSGRYAGIDRETDLNTAAASAGAQNIARQRQRDIGLGLKADVVNMGRGLPAQSAQAAGLGLSANTSTVGLNQANQQISNAATGIVAQGYSGAQAGYAGQAQTLNQQYSSQLRAWEAEQNARAQSAAGIGSAIGGIAGLFISDEDKKENKKPIKEGEALEAVKDMPVEEWQYKDGVADEGTHVGPYAQDFKRETGMGDGKTISAQDAIGITIKAVQDLDEKVEQIADAVGAQTSTPKKKTTKTAENYSQEYSGLAA